MNFSHTLHIALQALQRNKLRSFLTMVGIIIGVFAVIATVAVGDGATSRVQGLFASIGTNMLIVMPGASNQGGAFGGFGTQPTLTWDDLKAIRTEVPTVRYAAVVLRKTVQVQSEDRNNGTFQFKCCQNFADGAVDSLINFKQPVRIDRFDGWSEYVTGSMHFAEHQQEQIPVLGSD